MRRFCAIRNVGVVCGAALILAALVARAGGPLYVGGPNDVEGLPFRWDPASFPLTYWTDQGMLGNQTNTQADNLVAQAFQVWQDVPTASISFTAQGKLGADVTSSNFMSFDNALEDCSTAPGPPAGTIAKARSIVYDVNGSIVRDVIGDDPNSLLGFADPVCFESNGSENLYTRGLALLNGIWIDGVNTSTNGEVTLAEFRAVFIHEFGHLMGLDHSQINWQCQWGSCSTEEFQGMPTMFPYLVQGQELEMATLAVDDIAAISELYPTVDFSTTTGRIQGRIFFSDGATPAQGFNVIARRVDHPGRIAVSNVSGFLFTADAGNPLVRYPGLTPSPFGSRNQTLIGFFATPGLPPGDYTVEVEAIYPEFVFGSGLNPIGSLGFQFPLPGPSPPVSAAITVTAGSTHEIDITLNDNLSRFDAWEDE
jgi:hypothetical protein